MIIRVYVELRLLVARTQHIVLARFCLSLPNGLLLCSFAQFLVWHSTMLSPMLETRVVLEVKAQPIYGNFWEVRWNPQAWLMPASFVLIRRRSHCIVVFLRDRPSWPRRFSWSAYESEWSFKGSNWAWRSREENTDFLLEASSTDESLFVASLDLRPLDQLPTHRLRI